MTLIEQLAITLNDQTCLFQYIKEGNVIKLSMQDSIVSNTVLPLNFTTYLFSLHSLTLKILC